MKLNRTTSTGYKWDYTFWIFSLIIVASFAIVIMAEHNFNFGLRPYVTCKGPENCLNPLYWAKEGKACSDEAGAYCIENPDLKKVICEEPWCKQIWLKPGTYGEPPDPRIKQYLWITIIVFLLPIPLNHLYHNKGKKFDLGLKDYYRQQLPWLMKKLENLEIEE